MQKIDVFGDLVFGGILEGFGEGFGRPKTSIFAFFSKQILEDVLERQKIEKKIAKDKKDCDFGPAQRNVRRPGER